MQPKIKKHLYDCRYIYAAFFISTAIFLIVCAARNIFPFGDRTVLKVDLFHQYAPFLEEFRERILSGKSLIYSWETGLGKDFISQTAYYTTSPLNLLVFLFPRHLISEVVTLLILLKVSLSASAFTFYLREHFRRNDLSILVFGLLYAFCAFVTCYYWNIMWLDTVVLFPLVALGCERLISENRVLLYFLSLTLTMIVNFYLAVLVCILTALYALVYAFSNYTWKADARFILRSAGRFILVSVLCAVSSLVILAPVAAALGGTEVSNAAFPSFEIYSGTWQLISAHFLGARDAVLARNEDMPNVYTGVLTLTLLPLYFGSRHNARREKLLYSLFLIFMLLCACIRPLDFMIHGFHFPANLPHRYTFVYSFILLVLAYKGFLDLCESGIIRINAADSSVKRSPARLNGTAQASKKGIASTSTDSTSADRNGTAPAGADNSLTGRNGKDSFPLRALYITAAVYIAAILVYEYLVLRFVDDIDHVLTGMEIWINVGLIILYLAVITFVVLRKKKAAAGFIMPRFVLPLLLICVIGECTYSFYQNLNDTGDRNAYIAYLDDTDDALSHIEKEQNGEFCRTEFRRFTTINDGALYHYNGFSQFSSLSPGSISSLMEHLGVAATSNSYRYYDPTALIDAIFGIRYVMNKDGEFPPAAMAFKYTLDAPFDSVWVYRNDRVLPLGFLADSTITEWETEDSQPFSVQNSFIHTATGIQEDLFTMFPAESVTAENIEMEPLDGDNCFNYTLPDPANLSLEPTVHAEFVSDKDQYIYLYVNAPNAKRFIYADKTVREDRELSAGRSLIDVGHVSAGEKIIVDFALTKRGQFEKTYRKEGTVKLYAASYNDDVFQKAYDKLNESTLQISSFKDTRIEGSINADRDGMLFTSIPFRPGWSVTVDGEKTEKCGLGENGLIGIPVRAGDHVISLEYHSPYMPAAAVGSVCGVGLFILYCMLRRRRKA